MILGTMADPHATSFLSVWTDLLVKNTSGHRNSAKNDAGSAHWPLETLDFSILGEVDRAALHLKSGHHEIR